MKAWNNPFSVLAFAATIALLTACERDPPASQPAPNPTPTPEQAANPGGPFGNQAPGSEPSDPLPPTDPPPFAYQPNGEITGCYGKTWIEGGNPHIQKDAEFCIEQGPVFLLLVPGVGVDWQSCSGLPKIRLVPQGGTLYKFCTRVLNHPQAVPPHGPNHAVYQIVLYPPGADGKKYAMITAWYATAGGPVHGGTAHAQD